ncbi:MAG TPA: asparaginase [Candidatus Baltobacteraceae bacterium]|nr:asparaginase [Candidatus Baltobacteraceae bacterium]
MHQLEGRPIVEVNRGDLTESFHDVAACASSARGDILFSVGDIDAPVFLRSSAKPFIAAATIEAGVREAFGLDMHEIAVMAASHSGEPFHVEAVRSILEKAGLGVSDLQCGAHVPYNEAAAHAMLRAHETPSALHNNCSGKHAGILALCKVMGADVTTYLDIENPAQQRILAFCARTSDDDPATWPLGIDGCGIPVYATTLRKAALAFARFASLEGLDRRDAMALLIVRDAMVSHPEYVGGTGEFDSVLMRAAGGSIACKVGAEGVHGVAVIPQGVGYASKVIDGASRGRSPVTVAALRHLGALSEPQLTEVRAFAHPIVYNRAGRAVGDIRVAANFAVEEASSRT